VEIWIICSVVQASQSIVSVVKGSSGPFCTAAMLLNRQIIGLLGMAFFCRISPLSNSRLADVSASHLSSVTRETLTLAY
jgi:hypothetical protein